MRKEILLHLLVCATMLLFNPGPVHAGQETDCGINKGTCSLRMGEAEVILDIMPKPVKAMEILTFTVEIKGDRIADSSIRIDLSMPGMYMGKNVVTAKRDASGKFTGKGIIPRCVTGRKLWQAKVPVGDRGDALFKFHVTY